MISHIYLATLQSAFLSLCSSLVTKYFTVHNPPISALVTFSFLCTPPNYLWQQFIEQKLPAYTTNKIEVDDGGKGVEVEKRLNIRNTVVKLLLEQTIIAIINVGAFLGFTKWFQGLPVDECIQVIREVGGLIFSYAAISQGFHLMSISLRACSATVVSHDLRVQALANGQPSQSYCHSCGAKDPGWKSSRIWMEHFPGYQSFDIGSRSIGTMNLRENSFRHTSVGSVRATRTCTLVKFP